MNAQVEIYIEKQNLPQKEIIQKLRALILETSPTIKEDFKMGVPWYEGKFYLVAFSDHVNLGLSVIGLSEQEKALFNGKGDTMRHLKFHSLEDVDETRVKKLLRLVADRVPSC